MSAAQPSAGDQTGDPDQRTGEPVGQAAQQISELARGELRLALSEVKDKGRRTGTGIGLFGVAGLTALAAVIALLALALPVWAAALIVAVVLFAVAAAGHGRTSRAMPPVPEQAVESTRRDVAEIKERTHR